MRYSPLVSSRTNSDCGSINSTTGRYSGREACQSMARSRSSKPNSGVSPSRTANSRNINLFLSERNFVFAATSPIRQLFSSDKKITVNTSVPKREPFQLYIIPIERTNETHKSVFARLRLKDALFQQGGFLSEPCMHFYNL